MKLRKNNFFFAGFTLFELVVVLAIISAMVVVVMPFCKRSNNGLKIRQDSSSIAQAMRYAIDLSEKRNMAVKFVFNEEYKSYCLQIEAGENSFEPMDDFTGVEKFLDKNIHLSDIEGFEQASQEYSIIFDPGKPWPNAWLTLSTDDLTETIRINAKYVEIEEENI